MPIVIELPGEFAERHGGHCVRIDGGRQSLFATGAVWDMALERGIEPPADALERLRLRLRFHATIASAAKDTFGRLKGLLLGWRTSGGALQWNAATLGVSQSGDGIKDLESLKNIHSTHSQKASELRAEIEKQPSILQQQIDAERQRVHREKDSQRQAEYRRQVEQIALDDTDGIHVDNSKRSGDVHTDVYDSFTFEGA